MAQSNSDRQGTKHFAQVIAAVMPSNDTDLFSLQDSEFDGDKNIEKYATTVPRRASDRILEQLLSNLLKYGVFLASAIVLIGGILYLIRHGGEPADYQFFQGEPAEFCSPIGVVRAVLSGSRRGLIQLGLLLLVATPMVRVVVSLLAFCWRRDFLYAMLTLLVLAGLIYSTLGAYLYGV
ncbi:MAG: DUF1634 domain-containing protein [Hydrococcus sp. Prado102]|jgi:uncharacterized membrane protein|nr:DUF1634 domain-containing protein [Hydrococcus sp. Prado102]